jgi:hypothetical protein
MTAVAELFAMTGSAVSADAAAVWEIVPFLITGSIVSVTLAFDSQEKDRNYKNPLTGSVYASRGLPRSLGWT